MVASIDIGINGAISIYNNKQLEYIYSMPIIKVNKENTKKAIDIDKLSDILDKHNIKIVTIEDIRTIFGISKSSMGHLLYQKGLITGMCVAKRIKVEAIHPKEWQNGIYDMIGTKVMNNIRETIQGCKKKETKCLSLACLSYFIGKKDIISNSIKVEEGKIKYLDSINNKWYIGDDGVSDSILLGYYYINNNRNNVQIK